MATALQTRSRACEIELGHMPHTLYRCSFDWLVGKATILPPLAHSARQRCCFEVEFTLPSRQ
jgi:hypothetical protein